MLYYMNKVCESWQDFPFDQTVSRAIEKGKWYIEYMFLWNNASSGKIAKVLDIMFLRNLLMNIFRRGFRFSTFRVEQNGYMFTENIFEYIFMETCVSLIRDSLKFVQLTISQHWFKKVLGTEQATSHYLSKYWPSSMTRSHRYIC